MQIYPSMSPLQLGGKQGSAVALGYFDGIHIGHRTVICGAVDWAQAHGAAAALFTFKLPGGSKIKGRRLYSVEEKRRIVAGLGVEHYLVPTFADIMSMTPEQFVRGLVADCRARAFFCGENFTFGARAAGDPALLQKLCQPLGVEVHILPMAQFEGRPVSSTRIRAALEEGRLDDANAMLGAPYAIDWQVTHGKGIGSSRLGTPTVNQNYPPDALQPCTGVYLTRIRLEDRWWPAATGIGRRPTVDDSAKAAVTCETYVPDFSGDLYGQAPVLEFHRYLCPVRKYPTLEDLAALIHRAAEDSKIYFAAQTVK